MRTPTKFQNFEKILEKIKFAFNVLGTEILHQRFVELSGASGEAACLVWLKIWKIAQKFLRALKIVSHVCVRKKRSSAG